MDKTPPDGAVKVKEERTLTGYFFRIFFWRSGNWEETVVDEDTKGKILSEQVVDESEKIINKYE